MKIVSGFQVKWYFLRFHLHFICFLIRRYGLTKIALDKWREVKSLKEQFTIADQFYRFVRHDRKVFLNCNIPGIPFVDFFERILNLADKSEKNELSRMGIVQIGFTKKCPLNCEHCYEGKILNQPDSISLSEHKEIVAKLQESGVPMIQFGGGEPLNRFDDLIEVLKSARPVSDFWIYSSGYGLNYDKAVLLKKHGLTGVSISIDHFIPEQHNAFRRNSKSFPSAIEAIRSAQNVGLLTAMTICVTKSFCTEQNLEKYHLLAHKLNVPFVQLMEPRATGNYEGKDVLLRPEDLKILEHFYVKRNTEKKYKHLPIVQYTGYQQRTKGCGGAGNRYIYIDTDGFVHSCPFCRNCKSHFLYGNLFEDLQSLQQEGCSLLLTIKN